MRADEGTQRLRDGAGEEEVRPGQLFVQVVVRATAGLYAADPGDSGGCHRNAGRGVGPPQLLALREAVAVGAALALLDGT